MSVAETKRLDQICIELIVNVIENYIKQARSGGIENVCHDFQNLKEKLEIKDV